MKFSNLSLAVLAGLVSGSALAQTYTVKLGGAYIDPNARSSEFSGTLPSGMPARPGVFLEVMPKATAIFSIERAITDNVSVELVLGVPPKHDVKLRASEVTVANANNASNPYRALDQHFVHYANETVATVKQSAPTLFVNYKFGQASDAIRPFVGVGINYTKMEADLTSVGGALYGGVPMTQKLTDSVGPAAQLGLTYKVDKQWSMNVGVATAIVSSNLTVSGNGRTHTAEFDFVPAAYSASVGYSF